MAIDVIVPGTRPDFYEELSDKTGDEELQPNRLLGAAEHQSCHKISMEELSVVLPSVCVFICV